MSEHEKPEFLELGSWAESLGASYLVDKGYIVRERGYRPKVVPGEIDLIVEKGEQLVFVEVRFRQTDAFAAPFETVGTLKQRRVAKAALEYVTRFNLSNRPIRFDVLSIAGSRVEHFEDAFDASILGERYAPYL